MNWMAVIVLVALGFLIIDKRRHPLHIVAGVIFILAGLLFTVG